MATLIYKWLFISVLPFALWQGSKVQVYTQSGNGRVNFHPFYISVTEINHNAKDKIIEISCKMFAEDFEQILEKDYKTQLDISSGKDKANFDKLIPDYINKHLSLIVDGKPVKLSYVGYEKESESAYCYFQVDNIPAVKKLNITNSILHDFNDAQINIMHVVVNGKRQSTKLDYPNTTASFSF
jgi:hypothetical protein